MKTFLQFLTEAVTRISTISQRKIRLFAVACCELILDSMQDKRSLAAVEVGERFADGQAKPEELNTAYDAAKEAQWDVSVNMDSDDYFTPDYDAPSEAAIIAVSIHLSNRDSDNIISFTTEADIRVQPKIDKLKQCIYTKCDKPLPRTPDILQLAKYIYDQKAWDSIYALADALEEAGVIDQDVLHHCRNDKVHARGCWVVDNILGKS